MNYIIIQYFQYIFANSINSNLIDSETRPGDGSVRFLIPSHDPTPLKGWPPCWGGIWEGLESLSSCPQFNTSLHSHPSAQRGAGNFQLRDPRLRPLQRARYRVFHAAHELNAGQGFKNPAQCRLKVKIFNIKVKEKDKEYTNTARQAKLWKIIKNIKGER